jgi:hypothetical protein
MDSTVREFIKSTYQSLTASVKGSVKGSLTDAWRMDGLGLLSISILVILAIYIYINSRCETCGFENPPLAKGKAKAAQYTGISDLPEAPQNNLADVNSLPYQDPAMVKGSTEMLRQLKQDMDGFSTFELEKMPDVSDPAVKLPITQFKGDYQRVKDELMVVNRTPGVQTSLTVEKINEMAANLRFLQRTYRTYANNELVPQAQTPMTQVGASETVEGFSTDPVTTPPPIDPSSLYNSYLSWMNSSSSGTTTTVDTVSPPTTTTGSNVASNVTPVMTDTPTHTGDPNYARITRTQLDLLVQKIAVEITRLQASGTTDPIVRARVNIFLRIKQSLTDIQAALDAGTMRPQDIPILVKDYNNFLPAIGSTSTGIAGLLSESGYPTLASLFNGFTQGDITNSEINNHLLHSYAKALINGLSYKFDISYTSANEVEARKAEAIKAAYDSGDTAADIGMQMKMHTGHPRTMHGSRGAFDSHVRQMDLNGFEMDSQGYSRPSAGPSGSSEGSGGFDWKGRAEKIFDNVKRAGMNPYDYGMDENVYANAINTDFSWRGYTKMVCSRLATNAEQGMAEKMGCPPASWIGWRS